METIAQNVHWLIPEETSPCDIFLQFRGQFALGVGSGKPISFEFLHKLAKARYFHVYIRKEDAGAWETWVKQRHPAEIAPSAENEPEEAAKYGNKRAEYISYMQKAVIVKDNSDAGLEKSFRSAIQLIQTIVKLPTMDWYFQQFHEPPNLFQHGARVTFPLTIFCLQHKLVTDKALEHLIFSSVIHELEGDPAESMQTVVSQQTLASLEKQGSPVPQEAIALIRLHDELCSGKGFPDNKKIPEIPMPVRVFTLFNHFDHYRLKATGTRRARFEATKRAMESRMADYDPLLWDSFWNFWERQAEAVS